MAAAAGGDEVKLLGVWDSPFVNRVQIVLNLKGISYQYVEEDLHNKGELLLASNPVHKKVPVLIHNGKPIPESQVIVQYIDEVWRGAGPSVLPAGPHERATARFWAAYVDDKARMCCRLGRRGSPSCSPARPRRRWRRLYGPSRRWRRWKARSGNAPVGSRSSAATASGSSTLCSAATWAGSW
ncbi:unnamed protein product [Triticum turgidum subsp. durum]|uniref:Glutathione S-transferase n=1 Tax=Triticum turgidum subsp. durum TaxID=4567 RepID=A0A9R0Q8X5_TRITD|nr:unnamed protein product [Triticum turgidum subsp. durum]